MTKHTSLSDSAHELAGRRSARSHPATATAAASATAASAPSAPQAAAAPLPELSAEVRRDTAVLEARTEGGATARAYVLGVSHVSRESCEEAAELIRAVQPEVVVLELCKDRLRLLLDQVAFPPCLTGPFLAPLHASHVTKCSCALYRPYTASQGK